MALLEDLKAQADSVGEEYPKSLTLRAAAEIKELRTTLGVALAALGKSEVLLTALRVDADSRRDRQKELNGEFNLIESIVSHSIEMAQDTLKFGL